MDLRQMRYFVTLASERNFSRAAERLHIAQPPLTRQIQQLEAELGTRLIDRTARPLSLTQAGGLFYDQAVQLLARWEAMRAMMHRTVAAERRRFVVGFVASTIYARLPALIRQFRARAPNVDLTLIELGSLDQIVALKEGRIDLGFGRIRFEDPAVSRTVLREETLVAAVPAGHVLAALDGQVSLRQIAEHRLIIYPRAPRPSYADQVLSLFHDQSLVPDVVHEARELQIAIGLVAAEEGICLVPESVRQSRTEDVCYLGLADKATSPIIMSRRIGDSSPDITLMSEIIVETYTQWGYPIPGALVTGPPANAPALVL